MDAPSQPSTYRPRHSRRWPILIWVFSTALSGPFPKTQDMGEKTCRLDMAIEKSTANPAGGAERTLTHCTSLEGIGQNLLSFVFVVHFLFASVVQTTQVNNKCLQRTTRRTITEMEIASYNHGDQVTLMVPASNSVALANSTKTLDEMRTSCTEQLAHTSTTIKGSTVFIGFERAGNGEFSLYMRQKSMTTHSEG